MKKTLIKSLCAAGLAMCALNAQAQFNLDIWNSGVPASGMVVNTPSGPITLEVGQQVVLPNGAVITIAVDTTLQPGTRIRINGQAAVVPFYNRRSLSIYYSGFSVAGQVPLPNGGFGGGTREVQGSIVSLNIPLSVRSKQGSSASIGGWYMFPFQAGATSIYQVHGRYFFTPSVGVQLAYLNSTKSDSPAATLYAIWRLSSATVDPNASQPWGMEIGVGVFNDFSDAIDPATLQKIKRNSINFSAMGQASLKFSKDLSLVGSYWFVRQRQLDFSRFGIGLSFAF